MKFLPFLFVVGLAGCAMLPEEGAPQQRLRGQLTFREMIALPPTATAHVTIVPVISSDGEPAAKAEFPARTGTAIPFEMKFPVESVRGGGEYLVLAQVIDHGRVWYSNLSAPLRLSFAAEPGDVLIELRPEPR